MHVGQKQYSRVVEPSDLRGAKTTLVFLAGFHLIRSFQQKTDHHFIHSPYMFGRSPRIYDSKVRFITVAQSRSRWSSSTGSSSVGTADDSAPSEVAAAALAEARAARSPPINRGPRSGQFRDGSNGFHLRYDKHTVSNEATRVALPSLTNQ